MEAIHHLDLSHSDWKVCEICHLYVYIHDVHIHQKHCTGEISSQTLCSLPHGFVYKGILHALVNVLKEEIFIPASFRPLVFMHPSTMKLFKFNMNENVVLLNGKSSAAFHICPNPGIHPSNVCVPQKQIINLKKGDQVSVHHYSDIFADADYASEIHITSNRSEEFMYSEDFGTFVLRELEDVFLHLGMTIHFSYKGKYCGFEIIKIQTPEGEVIEDHNINQLNSQLFDLNLCDENSYKTNDMCSTGVKSASIQESNHQIKCSTPISTKMVPMENNEISLLNFSGEAEENDSWRKQFQISSRSKIVVKDMTKSAEKKIRFKDIGGLKKQIEKIEHLLHPFFSQNVILSDKHLPTGIVLYGPTGTGKSLIVRAIANEFQVPVIFLERNKIFNQKSGTVIANLRKIFSYALYRAPCLLILDEIHTVYKVNISDNLTNEEKSVADELPKLIEGLPSSGQKRVIVIATTNKIDCLDSSLFRQGGFGEKIEFFIPNMDERRQIFKKLLDDRKHNLSEKEITDIISSSYGFTGADLQKVCQEATIKSRLRCKENSRNKECGENGKEILGSTYNDFVHGLEKVKPTIMREFAIKIPKVHWSDIGGMSEVKEQIMDMIDLPLKHPEAFEARGITPSRGVLMYGPPGCSKTMIAKAVATESQLNFLSVKGPELFNKFVGESEGAIRNLFRKAEASFPCVIFFDEIDSIAAERGNSSSGSNVGERVLAQLLTEIDGINVKKGICIIAATNRPDLIDPAFLRPGRFDSVVYVPLPDQLTRQEIFQIKLKKMPISTDIDIQYLVKETEGYSGAEIINVCTEAAMTIFCKDIDSAMTAVVTMSDLKEALKLVKPRTPKELLKFYEKFKSQYCHVEIVQ